MASAEHQDVALGQADPFGLLDRFDFRPGDRLARLQPGNAAVPGHVQQHAPADEAVLVSGDVEGRGSLRGHDLLGWPAVVDPALVGDVAQRVHVSVAVAVERQAHVVGGEGQRARPDVDVMALNHVMDDGAGVVRAGGGVHRDRHRHVPAGPDQGGRGPHAGRAEVVERAALIVGTPAAPVLDRLEDLLELAEGDRCGPGMDCHGVTHLRWLGTSSSDEESRTGNPALQ